MITIFNLITMKLIALLIISSTFSLAAYSQNEPSKKMPPMKMLPKEGQKKQIYELPAKSEYKIYGVTGELITEGNAEFIDVTEFDKGTYFIEFGGKKESFTKE